MVPLCKQCQDKIPYGLKHSAAIKAGIAARRARGEHVGCPRKVTPAIAAQMQSMHARGISLRIIASKFHVGISTVSANLKKESSA